eukprot:scaffold30096_cov86-Skeletonema_marinoi.AAC.2
MTLIQSKSKQSFPNYEATEDFLDFSRWQLPDERVITKRLSNNAKRFSGNYFCLYLILSIAYAIFMNWRILTAATIIAGGGLFVRHFYFYIYILEANDSYQGLEKKKGGSGSHTSMTSAAIYGGIAAVFVLYQFSVVTPLIVTLFVTMVIASIHAVARPFVGEHAYLLRPPHS